jgi:hypothetical protein
MRGAGRINLLEQCGVRKAISAGGSLQDRRTSCDYRLLEKGSAILKATRHKLRPE